MLFLRTCIIFHNTNTMKRTWTFVGAVLVVLLWATQVVWGAGQKPLIVKLKASGYDRTILFVPILKDASQPFHIRYRATEETAWKERTFTPDEATGWAKEMFELEVSQAGNYLIEFRSEELTGLRTPRLSNYIPHITIVSWGDVVWGEDVTYDFGGKLNILPDAGMPNLSKVKKLWRFTGDEFNSTNLLGWDVSNVEVISFRGAKAFNQNLGVWKLTKCKSLDFVNSGLSKENYSAALIAWATQADIATGVELNATGLIYTAEAVAAREKLIKEKKWTINGDTQQTSEVVFQFNDPKVVLYDRWSLTLPLFTQGLDLTGLRWEVEPEGFVYMKPNDNNGVDLSRQNGKLGKCTVTAILPARDGVHQELRAVCEVEVVEVKVPVIKVTSEGKTVFTRDGSPEPRGHACEVLPGKTYEVTISSPNPNEVFTVSRRPSSEYTLVAKGRNTWEFKRLGDWEDIEDAYRSGIVFSSLYSEGSKEYQRSFNIVQPSVIIPHFLNLLDPRPEFEKCILRIGSMKLAYSIVSGTEFLSVDPDGKLHSKKAGTAKLSVMFQDIPASRKEVDIHVLNQIPLEVDGVPLVGDKLRLTRGKPVTLSSPISKEHSRYFLRYPNLPNGIVTIDFPEKLLLTDAAAAGKQINIEIYEDASPYSNPYFASLKRTLTVEVANDEHPLTAFEVLYNGAVVQEGQTIPIMYRTKITCNVQFTPAETSERSIEWQGRDLKDPNSTYTGERCSIYGDRLGRFPITAKSLIHPELVRHFWVEVQAIAPVSMTLYNDQKTPWGEKMILTEGNREYINVRFLPEGAYAEVEYEIEPKGAPVFSFEKNNYGEELNFRIRSLKEGTGTLILRTKDKKLERRLTVEVIKNEQKFTLTLNNKTGLTVTTDPVNLTELEPRAAVALSIANPDNKTLKVTADHGATIDEHQKNKNYRVQLRGESTTVTIEEAKTFAVTLKKEGEGTLAIKGNLDLNAVLQGTELSVYVEAEYGYSLTSLTAGGKDILATKKFIVTADTEVKAVFTKNGGTNPGGGSPTPTTFTVTLNQKGEGTLAIVGHEGKTTIENVAKDTELTVTATAATGYSLTSLTAGGKDIFATKKFIVTANTEVKAVFTKNGGTTPGGGNGGGNNGGNNGGGNGGNNGGGNNPSKPGAVEDAAFATLTVAPNPFNTQLRISNPSGVTATYELVTLSGAVVRSGLLEGDEVFVDTETLPAGIYFVRIEAQNGAKRVVKVVKY